jgi:hypothetical protein
VKSSSVLLLLCLGLARTLSAKGQRVTKLFLARGTRAVEVLRGDWSMQADSGGEVGASPPQEQAGEPRSRMTKFQGFSSKCFIVP